MDQLLAVLDSKPELRKIHKLPLADWHGVGIELGISESALKVIQKNNVGDVNAQKREMFSTWLRQDVKATYRKLVKVLTKADLVEPEGDSAQKLADALGFSLDQFLPPSQPATKPATVSVSTKTRQTSTTAINPSGIANENGQQQQQIHQNEKPAHGEEMLKKLQKRELEDVDVKASEDEFIQRYCKEVKIILQAANDKERLANFSKLLPPYLNDGTKSDKIVRFSANFKGKNCTGEYTLGMFGGYKAALVQTEQGQKCRSLIKKTIGLFSNVSFIIGVGVAYGSSRDSTKLGDVLISEKIACLDNTKFDRNGLIYSRGTIEQVKDTLHTHFCKSSDRFADIFACTVGASPRFAKAHVGYIISGSFLVDNKEIKSRLRENAREAIGGEMEGHVLMDIMKNRDPCPFKAIIIKGVCDYGDGTKEKQWQLTAALAAVEYTHFRLMLTKGNLFPEKEQEEDVPNEAQSESDEENVASDGEVKSEERKPKSKDKRKFDAGPRGRSNPSPIAGSGPSSLNGGKKDYRILVLCICIFMLLIVVVALLLRG